MNDIDLERLSLEELKKLRKDVDRAIETFEARQKAEARAKLEEMARDMGYSLNDLTSATQTKTRKSAPPKFANPENPSQTWTGRGRKPKWVIAALDAGKSMDDLLIAK